MVHKIFLDISQETSMIKILTSPNLIILSCTIVPSCHIGCRRERERKRKREREREREREKEKEREKRSRALNVTVLCACLLAL
jgi:hypothetical protein